MDARGWLLTRDSTADEGVRTASIYLPAVRTAQAEQHDEPASHDGESLAQLPATRSPGFFSVGRVFSRPFSPDGQGAACSGPETSFHPR